MIRMWQFGTNLILAAAFVASAVANKKDFAVPERKYEHFADLLAGVLLLREGGVEEALRALPRLLNHTSGHIAIRESFKVIHSSSEKQKAANDALNEKLEKLNLKFAKLPPGLDEKLNKPKTKLEKKKQDKEQKIVDKLTAKLMAPLNQTKLDALNEKLASSKANLDFTPVDIGVSKKFENGAAIVSSGMDVLLAEANGVLFNPCVFSSDVFGVFAGATGIQFSPRLIDIEPVGLVASVTGINIQPSMLFVGPAGASVAPFGVGIAPTLIAVVPVGAFVQPFGIQIAPYLYNYGPSGVNIAGIGLDLSSDPILDTSYGQPGAGK